ncbi:MAG: ATP-binding protein, partial [Patescibacteria group bacterium]
GKVILLYGARQVGKTTLCQELLKKHKGIYLHCEINQVNSILQSKEVTNILNLFENQKLVILDEAQVIPNIGYILKLIHDLHPDIQIIATGSSSFDLANKAGEPLVGRSTTFTLFPLAIKEVINSVGYLKFLENIDMYLTFGLMPGVVDSANKAQSLDNLTSGYLYKDILSHEQLKNPHLLNQILKALAFQVGNLVSLREIASLLGTTHNTVLKYIELLEKTFVIYRLFSYKKNLRNELNSAFKVYFWDTGFRNWLIGNTTLPGLRSDKGALWENFCVNERIKYSSYNNEYQQFYFWRSYSGAEIDLVETKDDLVNVFEIKYSPKKSNKKFPKSFIETYLPQQKKIITKANIQEIIEK